MRRTSNDLDKFINHILSSASPKNKIKVLFFKIDSLGDITIKHGYVVIDGYSTIKNNFIDINASDYSSVKVTVSKDEGTVYRNNIWFKEENNNEVECLQKAIELFKKTKKKQLDKLNEQTHILRREIKRLDKLKEIYQEKIDNGEEIQIKLQP